jgi:hypothetical protein
MPAGDVRLLQRGVAGKSRPSGHPRWLARRRRQCPDGRSFGCSFG